jgi:hypothetical protein
MKSTKPTYCIYVIELNKKVLENKKFRKENPNYVDGKPCVYVGYTSRTPEIRLNQHLNGERNNKGYRLYNRYAHNFGEALRSRDYKYLNIFMRKQSISQDAAMSLEVKKAESLRKKGYAVWQK